MPMIWSIFRRRTRSLEIPHSPSGPSLYEQQDRVISLADEPAEVPGKTGRGSAGVIDLLGLAKRWRLHSAAVPKCGAIGIPWRASAGATVKRRFCRPAE